MKRLLNATWKLLLMAIAGYALLVMVGVHPIPRNGRGIGEAVGGAFALFLVGWIGALIARLITRKNPYSKAPFATGAWLIVIFTLMGLSPLLVPR